MQSINYDIVNAAKPTIGGQTSEMYKPGGKIALHKVSPISGFIHAASGAQSHMIGEFRAALE